MVITDKMEGFADCVSSSGAAEGTSQHIWSYWCLSEACRKNCHMTNKNIGQSNLSCMRERLDMGKTKVVGMDLLLCQNMASRILQGKYTCQGIWPREQVCAYAQRNEEKSCCVCTWEWTYQCRSPVEPSRDLVSLRFFGGSCLMTMLERIHVDSCQGILTAIPKYVRVLFHNRVRFHAGCCQPAGVAGMPQAKEIVQHCKGLSRKVLDQIIFSTVSWHACLSIHSDSKTSQTSVSRSVFFTFRHSDKSFVLDSNLWMFWHYWLIGSLRIQTVQGVGEYDFK